MLEKAAGKLCTKLSKAKGGTERKKIKGAKTRVTLQMSDIVNVATVEAELEETAVCDNIKCMIMYTHVYICAHLIFVGVTGSSNRGSCVGRGGLAVSVGGRTERETGAKGSIKGYRE